MVLVSWSCQSECREGSCNRNKWNTVDSAHTFPLSISTLCCMPATASGGPRGCLLCSLTQGCPLLGVDESISHLREWRSLADAYAPGFCWEDREDVSPHFGSHVLRYPHHFAKITGDTQFLFTLTLLDSCRLGDRIKNWAWWFQPVNQRTCRKGPETGWMSDSLFLPFLLIQRGWPLSVLSTETPENFAFDVASALISYFTFIFHGMCFSLIQNISFRQST